MQRRQTRGAKVTVTWVARREVDTSMSGHKKKKRRRNIPLHGMQIAGEEAVMPSGDVDDVGLVR